MSVEDCLRALAKSCLKNATEDVIASVLGARNVNPTDSVVNETVVENPEELADDSDASLQLEEAEMLEELSTDLVSARARAAMQRPAQSERITSRGWGRRPHTLPTLSALPFRNDRPLSFQEAKNYFPPGAVPTLELVRFQRWKVGAPYMPKFVTKVFGGREGLTQDESLRRVLSAAWQAYTASSGEQCPFQLGFAL